MKELDLRTRKALTGQLQNRYKKSSKKAKGKLLDEFVATTGYNRSYARRTLRRGHKERMRWNHYSPPQKNHPGRSRKYTADVLDALKKIWAILNFPCGKRITAIIQEIITVLEKWKEIRLTEETKELLHSISASTVDRILKEERKTLQIKGRSGTKPGSLLKHKIPIRTFADWDNARPGFLQIDLVGHEGGNARGDFCQTLDATDVATGWIEPEAIKNKAQVWVFKALEHIRGRLPFPLLGINSDCGSEFINSHFIRYCHKEKITFTRSRTNKKNDNCYVEQKNYTAVRQTVGYYRYDTPREQALLNQIYAMYRLYGNFFLPQMKLTEKIRNGSKVTKKYDRPQTPYARALANAHVAEDVKEKLQRQYAGLNPAKLRRDMLHLQEKLYRLASSKHNLWVSKTTAQENLAYANAM